MKLNEFVAETLKEIVDGVAEARIYYSKKGGTVNPSLSYRTNEGVQLWDAFICIANLRAGEWQSEPTPARVCCSACPV
jgi:hypothetical protein